MRAAMARGPRARPSCPRPCCISCVKLARSAVTCCSLRIAARRRAISSSLSAKAAMSGSLRRVVEIAAALGLGQRDAPGQLLAGGRPELPGEFAVIAGAHQVLHVGEAALLATDGEELDHVGDDDSGYGGAEAIAAAERLTSAAGERLGDKLGLEQLGAGCRTRARL
ncbi:hypothetical protein BOS5A_210859 [Bosea sp. EC-HK365B]|nr:hypothetical protein BOSE7B_120719 [Bosea sp. 7B]CAD5274736.1 hypothetical protein BOSE21B_30194 [Bosea sp. 21B]VVT60068.1 hypothetical protein BOS5A_210859 [Bosea sp. EC-HK365B]VXC16142.1 hypothetical protein BOSE127_170360 [Bosea sp. 127]